MAILSGNLFGNQRDLEVIDGSEANLNWDARWSVRTRIHEDRWVAEIAIPWRNLRYPSGADRLGVIFARNVRSLNEETSIPAVPRAFSIHRMAYAGELRGFTTPPQKANVQLNPYALSQRLIETNTPDKVDTEVGGELKWAITPSTVLDLTVNTDFAQADVDHQVINLDRFSVFFPERRQFFLENANIFTASVTEWISPFFSRRIGLDELGGPIPLDGGLRLTSRSSKQQLGLLAMRQRTLDTSPASNFAVARYSRNIAGQSRLGGMLTYRRDEAISNGGLALGENNNATYKNTNSSTLKFNRNSNPPIKIKITPSAHVSNTANTGLPLSLIRVARSAPKPSSDKANNILGPCK